MAGSGKRINKVKTVLRNPKVIIRKFLHTKFARILPDTVFIKISYRLRLKRKIDLRNPTTFNEKLQWLKLHDRNPAYTKWVDKLAVRAYVKGMIGDEYLIPLLGAYGAFDEIDFEALPNQFVLKTTHDSGGVVVCRDKKNFDFEKAKEIINKRLRSNFFWWSREWPYKNVTPRIICETYMADESGTELKDYKFLCFNGEVKCLFVCLNRNAQTGLNVDFYDLSWTPMPFERHYPSSGQALNKPRNFDKMIKLAETLSKDIPFVRVDFYETGGRPYFGELTFYPGAGLEEFTPEYYDYLLGSWIELPEKKAAGNPKLY